MKKLKTQAIITSITQSNVSTQEADKGVLTFDEKHFKFGYLNVAYSNIEKAEILTKGSLLFKEHYLVFTDNKRRYQFGPFKSIGFLKKLPISWNKKGQ